MAPQRCCCCWWWWWMLLLLSIGRTTTHGFPLLLDPTGGGGGTVVGGAPVVQPLKSIIHHVTTTTTASTTTTTSSSTPTQQQLLFWLQQGLVGVGTYTALLVNADRARGGCCVPDCVAVQDSNIAGKGLFATQDMTAGTILGHYPGTCTKLIPHLEKLQKYPHCTNYIWRFADNLYVIDPTNRYGRLDNITYGGSYHTAWWFATILSVVMPWWLVKDTMLCRINEPPLGQTTNVRMTENVQDRTVTLSLVSSVQAGEELLADYGPRYDRSGYYSRNE